MSLQRSVFEEHLNFYSRHTRGDPNLLLDTLYYEIGKALPEIDLEFPKGRPPRENRILSSHQQEQQDESINFDSYEVMLQAEQQKPQPEKIDDLVPKAMIEEAAPTPQPPALSMHESSPKAQPTNEELNRSRDRIPLDQIFDKGEEPSNVINFVQEVSQQQTNNQTDIEHILSQGLIEQPKADEEALPVNAEPWPQAKEQLAEPARLQEMTPQPIIDADCFTDHRIDPFQPPKQTMQYETNNLPPLPEDRHVQSVEPQQSGQQHESPKREDRCVATDVLSPRSEAKATQTIDAFEQQKQPAVLRESSLEESNSQGTPRKIPFRLAKKESKERRKKHKNESSQLTSGAESSSTTDPPKSKASALKIELPVTMTIPNPTADAPKKSFSKALLNKSPINKLSRSDMDLAMTADCAPPEPLLSPDEKKRLLSKFFASNS